MPFILLIVGILGIMSAFKGTYIELGQEIASDFKGSAGNPGFIYWVSSIIAVGVVGYYTPAQKFSRAFMLLIIIGMVLSNKGLFTKLQQALKSPQEPTNIKLAGTPTSGAQTVASASGGNSAAQTASTVGTIASAAKSVIGLGEMLAMVFV